MECFYCCASFLSYTITRAAHVSANNDRINVVSSSPFFSFLYLSLSSLFFFSSLSSFFREGSESDFIE